MLDFLTSSSWQFIAVAVSFVSFLVSIVIYLRQRYTKRLAYEVVSDTSIQSIQGTLVGISQLPKTLPADTHLVVLKMWNAGNIAIRNIDFDEPISISFGKDAEVLSAEIKSSNINFQLNQSQKNEISIEPFLLKPEESFSLQLLITNFKGEILTHSRITDMREIERRVTVLTRVMARRVQILRWIRKVRGICTTWLTIILGAWITTAFLQHQVVDYNFLFISSVVLGVILAISLIAERVLASKARSYSSQV